MQIDYRPVPSLQRLFTDETSFWKILVGPIGSTKTSACIFYLLYRAARQKPDRNGLRRTRFVISRTTLPQLKMTVLQDILYYLGPLVKWRPSENLILVETADIRSEWYLVPLDNPQDQRRLLSMQLSGVWFNEGREIPWELVTAAAGRVKRYPPLADGGVTHPFVLIDSNPGAVGSDLYNFCVVNPPENLLYIHQPSALSDEADWLHYLQGGRQYYETLMAGASEEWIEVHVHGRWGRDLSGAAVFGTLFDAKRHVEARPVLGDMPILVGLDPGRQPAAVVCQITPRGELIVHAELWSEDTSFVAFLRDRLLPTLRTRFWPGQVTIVMDPAGNVRSALSEHSPYTLCRSIGLDVRLAPTNLFDARRMAVERLLSTFDHDGRPQLVVNPNCTVLIRGLRGEYRYRRMRSGQLSPVPEKKHPVSDVVDALQYAALAMTQQLRRLERDRDLPLTMPSRPTGIDWGAVY